MNHYHPGRSQSPFLGSREPGNQRNKLSQFLEYLKVLGYTRGSASRSLVLGLIVQRVLVKFRPTSALALFDQEHCVEFRDRTSISFTVLEELLPYLEIVVEQACHKPAGFLPQGDWIVLDCGANIGFFSLQSARRCQAVYAFEPNPFAYRHLQRNIRANKPAAEKVRSYNLGLGAGNGTGYIRTGLQTTLSSALMPGSAPRPSADAPSSMADKTYSSRWIS